MHTMFRKQFQWLLSVSVGVFLVWVAGTQYGCRLPQNVIEQPNFFDIDHVKMLDSPNRFGGTISTETLDEFEQRIRKMGLRNEDVWFIYVRATSKFNASKYYAEIYLTPTNSGGRLYRGDQIALRSLKVEKRWAELASKFEEFVKPPTRSEYIWVMPANLNQTSAPYPVSLETLPIKPPEGFSESRMIKLVDFVRARPKMPDVIETFQLEKEAYDFTLNGTQIDPNRPIWQIEGGPDEPNIYLLDSDRRRKRGQLLNAKWIDGRYEVTSIGIYGASTGWFSLY